MNYTEEQLNEAYENTPEDLQGLLGDENLGFVIQSIGRENGITPEQSLDIEYLVVHTILGLREFDDLARNIRDDLKIDGNTAWKITREIRKNIFNENINNANEGTIPTNNDAQKASTEIAPRKASIPYNPDANKSTKKEEELPQTSKTNNIILKNGESEEPKAPTPPKPKIKINNSITNIPAPEKQNNEHSFEEKLRAAQKDMSGETKYKGIPDPYKERV